jgi:hypothetical protein
LRPEWCTNYRAHNGPFRPATEGGELRGGGREGQAKQSDSRSLSWYYKYSCVPKKKHQDHSRQTKTEQKAGTAPRNAPASNTPHTCLDSFSCSTIEHRAPCTEHALLRPVKAGNRSQHHPLHHLHPSHCCWM